jgi:hypothetical protein
VSEARKCTRTGGVLMMEVKQTYEIQYHKGEYKHVIKLVAASYPDAIAKFTKAFTDATITNIAFAGPICL